MFSTVCLSTTYIYLVFNKLILQKLFLNYFHLKYMSRLKNIHQDLFNNQILFSFFVLIRLFFYNSRTEPQTAYNSVDFRLYCWYITGGSLSVGTLTLLYYLPHVIGKHSGACKTYRASILVYSQWQTAEHT